MMNLIADDLKTFESFWSARLCSNVAIAEEISHYLMKNAGKRVRPSLIFLIARSLSQATPSKISSEHMIFATVVECFHNATLLHDDVVDEAKFRRNKESANIRWGNKNSILAGDYLYSHSLELLGEIADARLWQEFTRATTLTVEGELLQLSQQKSPSQAFQITPTLKDYHDIILAKTAHLFAVCGSLSAYLGKSNNEIIEAAKQFCLSIGILFQLVDDYLDYLGNHTGKSPGNDLKEGKMTLPLLVTYPQFSDNEKHQLDRLLGNQSTSPEELKWVNDKIAYYGGFSALISSVEQHASTALKHLEAFPKNPYTAALADIVAQLIHRTQ